MSQYAYVTVLYGNNIYLTGALILGYSLMKTNTNFDRVILVTPDVSDQYKSYLKNIYTHIIDIEYTNASPNIFLDPNTRFLDVFTKLECLNLVQYEKIILLDLDMIIAKNIDHLFKLRPPAACLKKYYVPYGQTIPGRMICERIGTNRSFLNLPLEGQDNHKKLVGSINAGLMLLKPNKKEWNDIKSDIIKDDQPNKYRYPEQDYLSLRYCNQWTSITFNYNFQFGLTNRVKKTHYKIDNIYVIHYSSSYKPWNDLLPEHKPTDDEIKFKKQHKKYYDLWQNAYQSIKDKFDNEGMALPY